MDNMEMARLTMIFLLVILPIFLAVLLYGGVAFIVIKDFIKKINKKLKG